MKVRVEKTGACRRVVHVEVPPQDVAPEYQEIVKAYARVATIAGFRQGKAPADVVERRFSRQIGEDAQERLVPRFCRDALRGEGITPVAPVEVGEVALDRERGLSFRATADVAPDFKLPRYRGIPLKRERTEVQDKDVEDALARLRDSLATFEDVSGRPCARGDLAQIDYRGEADGRPVQDLAPTCAGLGEGRDFWALLDEPEFLPGIVAGVIGLPIGGEKTVPVAFPADYRVAEVAGRTVSYRVTVKAIRQKKLPPLDEAFFKSMEVESESALRDGIRRRLQEAAETRERNRLKDEIARFLIEKTSLEVPQSLVEREKRLAARSIVQNIVLQGGTEADVERHKNDILSAAERSSSDQVKLSFILEKIADEYAVRVDDAEVNGRVEALARRRGTTPERLRAEMEQNDGLEWLRGQLRAEKTLDSLLEEAKVKN
jgi:trigger factor